MYTQKPNIESLWERDNILISTRWLLTSFDGRVRRRGRLHQEKISTKLDEMSTVLNIHETSEKNEDKNKTIRYWHGSPSLLNYVKRFSLQNVYIIIPKKTYPVYLPFFAARSSVTGTKSFSRKKNLFLCLVFALYFCFCVLYQKAVLYIH